MAALIGRKQELALGVLLVFFAALLWYELAGPGDGGGRPAATAGGGAPVRVDPKVLELSTVEWAVLAAPRPAYDPAGRNIFQFGVIVPPPPPPLTAAEQAAIRQAQEQAAKERERQMELARQQAEAQQKAIQEAQAQAQAQALVQASLPPPPPPKPQPPAINYKFIGYLGPPEAKIAVLHDGNDLLFVRQNETVGKDLKVLEIGYESIKFGFIDPQFKGESRTLPMSSSY